MDKPEVQLLADLILDVKKDVWDIKKDLSDTKQMSYSNSIVLDEHMRRSEAAEARLDVQEEKLDKFIDQMEPVREHVKTVGIITKILAKIIKWISIIASMVGAVLGVIRLLR